MADYDVDLQNHTDKINVVFDALSRKPEAYKIVQLTHQKKLLKEMMRLDLMVIQKISISE